MFQNTISCNAVRVEIVQTLALRKEKRIMISRFYIIWLVLAMSISGCATVEQDWQQAQEIDTIYVYESFLSRHPEVSAYAIDAIRRIDELKLLQKEQQKELASPDSHSQLSKLLYMTGDEILTLISARLDMDSMTLNVTYDSSEAISQSETLALAVIIGPTIMEQSMLTTKELFVINKQETFSLKLTRVPESIEDVRIYCYLADVALVPGGTSYERYFTAKDGTIPNVLQNQHLLVRAKIERRRLSNILRVVW